MSRDEGQHKTVPQAKAKIRRVARRAEAKGLSGPQGKKGLGITKNEGSVQLQASIKKLGYAKSKALVNRVFANQTSGGGKKK
jgi:hypothetical protein